MNAIFTRRSIRKYTQEPIPQDLIEKLLEAGMSAPSAQNQQPWHFVVMTKKATLTTLADVSPYSKMLKDAPLAILVCADLERELAKGFWVQDCSAAAENILIEAEALHLGAVWLGIYPRQDRVEYLRNALQIPAHIVPFALLSVGYPAETKQTSNRCKKSRVHYEQW